jgi:hypothetical protein
MPDDKDPSTETFISADKEKDAGVIKQFEVDDIVDMELLPLPDFLEVPNVYEPHLYPARPDSPPGKEFHPLEITFEVEEGRGFRGFVKKILVKTRKVVFPLIRFMTRPIYNELKQFSGDRYNENAANVFKNAKEIENYRLVVMQSKEYIKLLHNALNNMIVESSKLKIDHELQKTKIKVLEDKIEFLENRERAIEKKIFPGNK